MIKLKSKSLFQQTPKSNQVQVPPKKQDAWPKKRDIWTTDTKMIVPRPYTKSYL